MKIFISQKMGGLSEDQILERRSQIIEFLSTQYKDFEIIDSVLDPLDSHNALWYLGKSVELLSQADLAVFDTGWYLSRGCKIEFQCCLEYNIEVLFI